MKLTYKALNIDNSIEMNALVKWDNDEELYHLIIPTKDENHREIVSVEILRKRYEEKPEYSKGMYIIYDQDKPIGNFSLLMNPRHLMKKELSSSWLGLTIGEKEYWGTGAAISAIGYFEKESLQLEAKRIELGVFEFNHRARRFYEKLGFSEIGRLDKFTYWNGKYWDDIRMEKILIDNSITKN